jgi:hypothetical protein
MSYRIAGWTGIVAGAAGVVTAYYGHWFVTLTLGLLALVCAGIVVWKPPE